MYGLARGGSVRASTLGDCVLTTNAIGTRTLRLTSALIVTGLAIAGSVPGRGLTPAAASPASQPPNFVVVMTDDQRWDTIGRCLNGFDGTDLNAGADSCMPHVQQHLATTGTTFQRGYATTSLCCPARTSLLSGRYARHTGVLDNQSLDLFSDSSTLATWLDGAGYRTALIGKYTNGYGEDSSLPENYVPPGWDSWHAFWGRPNYTSYSMVHKDPGDPATTVAYSGDATAPVPCQPVVYSTDHLCDRAIDFLAADTTDPFFLLFSPFSPHPDPIAPSRWHLTYRQEITLPEYPNYNQVPQPNPPSYLRRQPLSDTMQNIIGYGFRAQLRANRAVDDAVHALHEQLRADGRLDRTVWIYLSDHGLARGEHRWDGKACEYEECHRIPFIVACPATVCPEAQAGLIDANNMALNIDIAPTVAELAGITPPGRVDGRSLVPLLSGISTPWRSSFLLEDHGLRPTNRPLGIVSTLEDGHTYKYVRFISASTELELFDLTTDPWELANLAFDPDYAAIRARLEDALEGAFNGPVVSITSGPPSTGSSGDVRFEWTADRPVSFGCRLDAAAVESCGGGTAGSIEYSVGQGTHSFGVRGTDEEGNEGEEALWSFTVGDVALLPPTLTGVPASPSLPDVAFSFTHDDAGVNFGCALDASDYAPCSSPRSYSGLSSGAHEFRVRAVSGSTVSDPATHAWSVDGDGPSVTITSDPDRFMTDTKIGVVWSADDDTGIVRYDVFRRTGTRGPQALVASTTDIRHVHTGTPGATYCYQVEAVDGAGRRGTSNEVCRAIPHDDRDTALATTGAVRRLNTSGPFGSTLTVLEAAGQQVELAFNGRRYGLLLRQSPSSGMADVYLDGILAARIDLYHSTVRDRIYALEGSVADEQHTVALVWTGQRNPSSSGTDIALDAVGTISWGT